MTKLWNRFLLPIRYAGKRFAGRFTDPLVVNPLLELLAAADVALAQAELDQYELLGRYAAVQAELLQVRKAPTSDELNRAVYELGQWVLGANLRVPDYPPAEGEWPKQRVH